MKLQLAKSLISTASGKQKIRTIDALIPKISYELGMKAQFQTKQGIQFNGVSAAQLNALRSELREEYGILPLQTIEAASYSMAMVVRFALGLSAAGGKVCAVAKDSLAGCIALATVRHLVNAGASAQVLLLVEDPTKISTELAQQALPLRKLQVPLPDLGAASEIDGFTEFLGSAHNVIFGTFAHETVGDEFVQGLSDLLNEERTPVHCIEAPAGVNPDSGAAFITPLFASSTLSLGAPFAGLYAGREYVGRHYLCDVSASAQLYRKHQCDDLSSLFSDQPVVQIFPIEPEE